jgi:hypothetical protein
MKRILTLAFLASTLLSFAQEKVDQTWKQKFEQLGTTLPTPNTYRTASGAPGHEYWQQRADYKMQITLNDANQTIAGKETITYFNQSPDVLTYMWLQLDQNMRAKDSDTPLVSGSSMRDTLSTRYLSSFMDDFDGGFKIASVTDAAGKPLKYLINKTMMRVELPQPLKKGESFAFKIDWSYNINNRMFDGGRSGLEYFEDQDEYLYTIAQFFPRMVAYMDNEGWQNKQFLGSGEFTLNFGNYEVDLTVPADFVVGATGTLQNQEEVLTKNELARFKQAQKSFDKPVIIVTQDEAIAREKNKANVKGTKTWKFKAENVRDFAFCASRKFIWDAQAVKMENGATPLAMSYYPKEGNPLWEEWSTKAVAQTLKTYSKHTIDYPYPVAISVHTASIGMEYPMICFNYGRPNPDGTYSDRLKYGMISVIIHEVGHNYFPMIINSDERQWTWMDEGLNTFTQYLTEKALDPNYPSRRGPAENIINYMKGDKDFIRPIMTNSEQLIQFGNNAYAKPATALNMLREVIMGPELFDYAFKEYARRWAFKHPTPADFFRTMEDASAVDLDWFWKGWFFTTDHVDVSIDNVKWYKMLSEDKDLETRNVKGKIEKNQQEGMMDFGAQAETFVVTPTTYTGEYRASVPNDKFKAIAEGKHFYEVTFKNKGGLVTPILIEWTYADGTKEMEKLPAEIWKMNENQVTKTFMKNKEVTNIVVDPNKMTADVDTEDNVFPRKAPASRLDKFKEGK